MTTPALLVEPLAHLAHRRHNLIMHDLPYTGTTFRYRIGWWERAAHWSEEASDELLGSFVAKRHSIHVWVRDSGGGHQVNGDLPLV
jgi:hypothetical protein